MLRKRQEVEPLPLYGWLYLPSCSINPLVRYCNGIMCQELEGLTGWHWAIETPVVCLGYCKDVNHDWGCLCSDQQHIAPVSMDQLWNSHRALCCCCFHWKMQFVTLKDRCGFLLHYSHIQIYTDRITVIVPSVYTCCEVKRDNIHNIYFMQKLIPKVQGRNLRQTIISVFEAREWSEDLWIVALWCKNVQVETHHRPASSIRIAVMFWKCSKTITKNQP